ncbi:EpsG family protein [Vibrio breoganii]
MYLNINHLNKVLLSLFIVSLLVIFPWDELTGRSFTDLDNYARRIEDSASFYFESSLIKYISGEYLWRYLSYVVYVEGVQTETFFLSISVFSCAIVSLYTVYKVRWTTFFILIITPSSIYFFNDQLRSCFALAIFLVGITLFRKIRVVGLMLILCSMLIHTSLVLLVFVYFFAIYFEENPIFYRLKPLHKKIFLMFSSIVVFYFLSMFLIDVLKYIGDRRSEYSDIKSSVSFAIIWLVILISVTWLSENNRYAYISIMIISLFLVFTFNGMFGTRFIMLALPFICISINSISLEYKAPLLFLFFLNSYILWSYYLEFSPSYIF